MYERSPQTNSEAFRRILLHLGKIAGFFMSAPSKPYSYNFRQELAPPNNRSAATIGPPPERGMDNKKVSRRGFLLVSSLVVAPTVMAKELLTNTPESNNKVTSVDSSDSGAPPQESDSSPESSIESFIKQHEVLADRVEDVYGVPSDVVLAMSILESGYGQSKLATEANNYHGLKANKEWSGDTYEQMTIEHRSEDYLIKEYGAIPDEATPLGGGMYEMPTIATFKKFPSAEDGFMGFGHHLRTRLNGEAYADAFRHTDSEQFILALFDDIGSQYATDIRYQEKVLSILDQVIKSRGHEAKSSNSEYSPPLWKSDDMNLQRVQFNNEPGEYHKTIRQLRIAEENISEEGYRKFLDNITDVSDEVARLNENAPAGSKIIPSQNGEYSLVDNDSIQLVLHYTAWPPEAWGHDGIGYATSLINSKSGACTQFYLGRGTEGKLYITTDPGIFTWHALEEYSQKARGVEIPAGKQSDIDSETYENLAYLVIWQWRNDRGDRKPTLEELKEYVIGHGEISELRPDTGNNHGDFPRAIADYVAFLAYLGFEKNI